MKKLHGTYSIQPLTITDAVIAEDAQISESKLNLSFSTANIQQNVDDISLSLESHLNSDTDPHGEILHQTTLQTENIQSDTDISTRTITVSNPGEGDVLLQVEGDISAVNASFSGDTNIAGITTIGGQTHITGNVVIDGNLSVSGETTTVESNTIDYDSLLVTPSTALNRTGIIVAPDGTGFTGDTEPVTTLETITVHDDIMHAPNGLKLLGTVGQDKDLLFFIAQGDGKWDTPRVILTSYDGTEIKAKFEPDTLLGGTDTPVITTGCVGSDGYIYLGCDLFTSGTYTHSVIYKMNTDLELIATSDPITVEVGGTPIASTHTLRYMECYNGKLHLTVCDEDGYYQYVLAYPMSSSPDFDTFTAVDLSTALPEGAILFKAIPYSDGNNDHYIVYTDLLIYMIDPATGELEHEICDAHDDYGTCYVFDKVRGKIIENYDHIISEYSIEGMIALYGEGRPDPEASTLYTDFAGDPEVNYQEYETDGLLGMADANTILYYSAPENKIYWLDIRNLIPFEDYIIDDEAEHTISLPDGYESDPVIITSRDTIVPEPSEPEEDIYDGVDIVRTVTRQVEVTVESSGDTFTGNLLELQKRTRGFNEAAVIVDKSGNLRLLTGGLEVGGIKGTVNNNTLTFDKGLGAASMITSNAGFIYKPSSDAQPGSKVLDIQDASGVSNAFITKNGDATVNSLTIGASNPITEVGTGLLVPNDVNISGSELLLDDSVLTFSAENKDEWRVLNRNSSVSFYFDVENVPQMELSDGLLDLSNCDLTKTDDLEVMGSALFRGSVSMAANTTVDGIRVGSHDHTGGEMGTVLPQTAVTGLKTFIDNINTTIQSCVNTMTTGNTESGINVAFDGTSKKLNFTVNDFTLTLTGDAAGSATIAHASNTSLAVTVKDSAKLGGLSLPSTTANTEANKVVRTDNSANTTLKTLSLTAPVNANTATIAKIYASTGNETAVKYYTPANFATQLLALGGTTKNSHTHTAVNGLTPIRGSSTFNGVSGRVIMLSSSRANTNYSVAVTPSAAPNGNLGEVWVIKGTDRFTVYNSGTATTAFDYIMLG